MNRKRRCLLAAVTAMLFLTGLMVWILQQAPAELTGESSDVVATLTSSIVLYVAYLFSTITDRPETRK